MTEGEASHQRQRAYCDFRNIIRNWTGRITKTRVLEAFRVVSNRDNAWQLMESKMETPESIRDRQLDYKDKAWEQYTPQELGNWVHLFLKRSQHRVDKEKAVKDITDAQNYLNMLQAHVDAARESMGS